MENHHHFLPEGYSEAFVFDVKDRRTSMAFTSISLLLAALCFTPVLLTCDLSFIGDRGSDIFIGYIVFLASLFGYMVLHELVHGAVYKVLTHERLTFGITLTVAFCGVPDIYTSRRTALLSLSAPFVVFSVILIPIVIVLHGISDMYFVIFGLILAMHIGGCAGDLYGMYLLFFRFKDPSTLMNDTGPKQTFYVKR